MVQNQEENNNEIEILLDQIEPSNREVFEKYSSIKIDFHLSEKQNAESLQVFQSSISHIRKLEINFGRHNLCSEDIVSQFIQLVVSQLQLTSLSMNFFQVQLNSSLCEAISLCLQKQGKLLRFSLVLSSDHYSIESQESILNSICRIPTLKYLETFLFEIGKSSSLDYQKLAQAITNMSSLKNLTLKIGKFNKMTPLGAQQLSRALSSLKTLEIINLSLSEYDSIGKESRKSIIDSFQSFSNIQALTLAIHGNCYDVKEILSLFSSFSYLIKAEKIDFVFKTKSKIPLKVYIKLKSSLQNLKQLKDLSFGVYDSQSGVKESQIAFAKCFTELTWLDELKIKFGEIVLTDITSISTFSNSIGGVKGLTNLEININTNKILSLKEFELLAESIGGFTKLTSLQFKLLIVNRKKPELRCYQQLFSQMRKLITLQEFELEVSDTTLEGTESLMYLPSVTEEWVKLRSYALKIGRKNKLDNQGFKYICESIENIKHLVDLSLDLSDFIETNTYSLFGTVLEKKVHLENLNLKLSYLSQEFVLSLCASFQSLNLLKKLHLNIGKEQPIESKSACSLIDNIKYLTQLNTLELHIYSDENYKMMDQININNCIDHLQLLITFQISIFANTQLTTQYSQKYEQKKEELPLIQLKYRGRILTIRQANENILAEDFEIFWEKYTQLKDWRSIQLKYDSKFDMTLLKFQFLSSLIQQQKSLTEITLLVTSLEQKYSFQRSCGEEDFVNISSAIKELKKLKQLNIEIPLGSNISQETSIKLKQSIQDLVHLEKIKFVTSNCQGDLELVAQTMEAIQSLKNIAIVDLQTKGEVNLKISSIENDIVNKNDNEESELTMKNSDKQNIMLEEYSCFYNYKLSISVQFNNRGEKEKSSLSKCISSIGRILQFQSNYKKICIETHYSLEIEKESMQQFSKGLNNQQEIKELDLKTYPKNNIFQEEFKDIVVAILKQDHHLKQLNLSLIGNETIELLELFKAYSSLQKLPSIQKKQVCFQNNSYALRNIIYCFSKSIVNINRSIVLEGLNNRQIIQSSDFIQMSQGIQLLQGVFYIQFSLNLNEFFNNLWVEYQLNGYSQNPEQLFESQISMKSDRDQEIEGKSLASVLEDLHKFQTIKLQLQEQCNDMLHKFELKNPFFENNISILQLTLAKGFQLDDRGQESLLKWIGSCKQLKELNFDIDSRTNIYDHSLVQLGEDISNMSSLNRLKLTIQYEDSSTQLETYFQFCNSLFKKYQKEYVIYLGRGIRFELVKNGYYDEKTRNYIYFIKDKIQYRVACKNVANPSKFAEVLLKQCRSLQKINFYFFLTQNYSHSIQLIYKSYMEALLKEQRVLQNVGVRLVYSNTQQLIDLFKNTLSHTRQVSLLKILYSPYHNYDRSFRDDLKLYIRELQYVTALEIYEPQNKEYIALPPTQRIKQNLFLLKRLVLFRHYQSAGYSFLF